jgi:uncharacterized membrane protein YphA (DoxX/SURF4 family)
MNLVLWILQVLLAALFLFAGSAKLSMSAADLAQAAPQLSAAFLRFVSVCEILGGLGLLLPSALRIMPWLTPLAAAGLVVIMIGATIVTLQTLGVAMALMPAVTGILCAWVAYARWRVLPIAPKTGGVPART